MNAREKRLDKQTDKDLQRMFDQAAELEGQALWNAYQAELEAGTLPETPKEMEEACRNVIQKSTKVQKRIQFPQCTRSGLAKVAICTIACLFLLSITAAKVDAIRIPVLNFLTDRDGRYSKIQSYEHKNDQGALLREKILSAPLPDGYELVEKRDYEDGTFSVWFKNDDAFFIRVRFFLSDQIINYDVEDAEQIKTKVLNHDAILIKKEGLRILWMDEKYNGVFDVKADGLVEDIFWEYVLYIAEL